MVAALHRQQSLFTQLHLSPPIRFGYTAFFNQLAFHKMIFLDKVISVIWAVVAGYNRGPYSCNRLYLKSTHNFSLKSYAQPSINDTSKTAALSREEDIDGLCVAIMVTGVYLYPTCV